MSERCFEDLSEVDFIHAVMNGCIAGDVHLTCIYPACGCKTTPLIVRGALQAIFQTKSEE